MPSRSVKFKAYHGEKGKILDNDDTWLELAGYRVTEFVLLEPEKMDLVTAKSWFTRYLPPLPLDPARPSSCGDITFSAVFSLSCTDIKWQLWPIETTADWRNWIRGCVDRRMPPVAVVDAIAKVPPSKPPQAPKAAFPTTALEIAAYTQAEQHAREIIARVDAQVSLLTVGASMSRDEHFAAWQRVGEAAKKMLAILRPGSSDVQPPPQPQPQPQANYRDLPPSFVPGYQPARPPPPNQDAGGSTRVRQPQPQPQENTYLGLGLPPGCNLRQTNQPAPPPAPPPANQAGGGCGQPAPGVQGAANMAVLDSVSSTSASSPVQRGTLELPRPQKHKAGSRPKPPATTTPAATATPPATEAGKQVVGTGRARQFVMVTPQGTTPCWFPPPPAGKRARPNPTTTRPSVGAVADAEASPAPATGGGSGVGGI